MLIDLDGTLVDASDNVSERNAAAVRAAAQKIPVGIASGRTAEETGHYARLLGLETPQIGDNGARLTDPATGRTISDLPIDPGRARQVVERLQRDGLRYFGIDSGRLVRSIDEFTDWRVTIITRDAVDRAEVERLTAESSDDGVFAVGSRGSSGRWYVDYMHPEAHKGYGAQHFCELVGVDPDRTMAIGDGLNDLQLFDAIGLPVAMGHAPEDIRGAAAHVTGTIDENGVAQAIERFVL